MGFSSVPLDLVKIRKNQRRLKGLLSNPENPNDHLNLQHYPVSIGQLNSYALGSSKKNQGKKVVVEIVYPSEGSYKHDSLSST